MKAKLIASILAAGIIAGGLLIAHAQTGDLKGSFGRRSVIANKLQLTTEQRMQVKTILVAGKSSLVADFTQLHEARIHLRATIQSAGATEVSVRAASAGAAVTEADMAVERWKLHNQIFPLLAREQKGKVSEREETVDTFVDGVIDRIEAGLST
jgi:Spy/CpxP family protein refolding chaperone